MFRFLRIVGASLLVILELGTLSVVALGCGMAGPAAHAH